MTFFESFSIFLDFRTTILRILSWSTRKKSPRYLWKMCWNSDQSHYILCHHGHHLHRLQIRNLHRLQMQDFCSFGFTLDWSILWRFRRNIRLKYKCTVVENHRKVSFNIASEASYVYILSGQKLIKNAKNGPFWRVFENLKIVVKQCSQTGQF